MSTEVRFTRVGFPELPDVNTASADQTRAHARGHAAGYAAGLRAAEQELRRQAEAQQEEHRALLQQARAESEALLDILRTAAQRLADAARPVVDEVHEGMLAGAVDIAEAIIGVELSDGDTAARSIAARALAGIEPDRVIAVRLHPRDLQRLRDLDLPSELHLTADPALGEGDAIVDFADGYLDARIGAAVDRVRNALAGPT